MPLISRQFKTSNLSNCPSFLLTRATPCTRLLSTRRAPSPKQNRHPAHHTRPATAPLKASFGVPKNAALLAGVVLLCAFGWSQWPNSDANQKIFDPPRFTPFQIIAREEVSPTSIILTVCPPKTITTIGPDPYEKWWKTGTWSVEVKQPQLQIARSYTPLPPREGDTAGNLRFLIRKEPNGEVSGYLHRLQVGGTVELRGPRTEIDLSNNVNKVVFLAGGTGIAPALQVAHILFERKVKDEDRPDIHIVWANRRREDCVGGGSGKATADSNYIVRELEGLRQKYPDHVKVDFLVDEEKTFLDQKKISQLTKLSSEVKYGPRHERIDSRLLILSGPEGFINYFAGPKKWEGGKEGQGEIGGVIGAMRLRDWKVWKL